jgi:hypothetical protein
MRIIVFAKAPQPGRVKTRLIPALGEQGAAELARRMLLDTLHAALAAGIGEVELCSEPMITDPAWRDVPLPQGIAFTGQGGGDLGERMARAFRYGLAQADGVLLIGTDCAEISAQLLREAARSLQRHDAVIHRSYDGGYTLLGLKRFDASLFSDIPWSTPAVAGITLSRLEQLGWSVDAEKMVHDVDEPQDLQHLSEYHT